MKSAPSRSRPKPARKVPGGYKLWALALMLAVLFAGNLAYRNKFFAPLGKIPTVTARPDASGGKPFVPPDESPVSVVQSDRESVSDMTEEDVESLVREAVRLAGGLAGIVKNGDTVVLKPNLVLMRENDRPDSPLLDPEANGVTTDWRVTRAVARMVRELNPTGKIIIMENSAVGRTESVMAHLKYTPERIPEADAFLAIERDSGDWRDSASPRLTRVVLSNGLYRKSYYLNRTILEADVLISLPVLKNHFNAVISGSLKNVGIGTPPANIYGVSATNALKIDMVNHLSDDLHKWIRDYILCRRIDFTVVDGLQGLQNGPAHGRGPISNDQMNMRLVMAGRDAVAVDTLHSILTGWDPESVNHIRYLALDRAGNGDVTRITVAGLQPDEVRKIFQGQIPMAGGSKYFDYDPPDFTVAETSREDGRLVIRLEPARDTRRMDVFWNGRRLLPPVTNGFERIEYPLPESDRPEDRVSVRIRAFDRFFNRAEANFFLE